MVPCSKFQFVHNSNLSFKEELNIFLLDLRSKYVLCLLFLKEISRFQTTCALNICGLILLFCLNQQLFTNQRMVPLIISTDGFSSLNWICIESLQLIRKDVFQCLITTHVKSSLKVYQILFFKHFTLKHMHTYIYTQVCKNQTQGSSLSFLSSFVCEVMSIAWLWLN